MALTRKFNEPINTQIPQVTNNSNDIVFDERQHKYYKNGIELQSVTTFLDAQLFPKFTEGNKHIFISNNVIKANTRKGYGITNAIDLRRDWHCKGNSTSCDGTSAHEFATRLFIHNKYGQRTVDEFIKTEVKTGYHKAVLGFWEEFNKEWKIIESEKRLASLEYNLAGTLDILAEHRTEKGRYAIGDYKAKESLDKTYNICKNELSKFKDSGENKAIAQMTIYSIMGKYNVKPEDIFIVKLNYNGTHEIRGGKYTKLPDMRKEIKKALVNRSKNNPNKKYILSLI